MSWADQNELMRLAKKVFDSTGSKTPSENAMISQLASTTGVAYTVARDAYVKSILDPLLQERVRKSMTWLINANFVPEFVNSNAQNRDLDDSAETTPIKSDGVDIPKRMFNIDTGNMEEWVSGQYVILSHSWKGEEITYTHICKVREGQKKRELYEMAQDDPDEETRRIAKFKAKKFQHLKAGQSDIELLSAQCTKDIQDQDKKIQTILSRISGNSTTRDLLNRLVEYKIASAEKWRAQSSFHSKEEELKLKEMESKWMNERQPSERVDASDVQLEGEEEEAQSQGLTNTGAELLEAKEDLLEAKKTLEEAKARLTRADEGCKFLNQNTALRSAIDDLLSILERKKSMNKIEGSMREAKKILGKGLFPSNGRKRYLWNDTCCINKTDANELNVSLAMMGEWYNNADFCLVHLDTPESTEWVDTWDHLNSPAEIPNFPNFDTVKAPNWATRGWTLQELVLSKMAFYVNSLWQPLTRPAEGLGPYYYHCSYLAHHMRDPDASKIPQKAISILQNPAELQKLIESDVKIDYISYEGSSENWRRLIGILDFLHVAFPGDMNDDNADAYIRYTISTAAFEIETRVTQNSPDSQKLRALFTALGFDLTAVQTQARTLIKIVVRALVKDSRKAIHEDREKVATFTQVPPDECCRGLSRSRRSAYDILVLASYRKCTVPIDRVYSLMGVLGVKIAAFHAEGPTKALCRLLDEIVITTNDISVFNWAGKNLGSTIRGRSLYPLNLTAFSPEDNETQLTARQNDELSRVSKQKRYIQQDTESRLTTLLRGMINYVRTPTNKDVPVELIRSIIKFIKETSLEELRPQLENLGKLLVYVENTPSYEGHKPITEEEIESEISETTDGQENNAQSGGMISQLRMKAPQIPQFSAPKLSVGGFGGRFGKKAAPSEPEPVKESPDPTPETQPLVKPAKKRKPHTPLVDDITDWVSKKGDLNVIPDEFKSLFQELKAPNTDAPKKSKMRGERKHRKDGSSHSDSMICPNPITLTTSGIEGIFDVQRVIITMHNADELRYQVEGAVNKNQKISGQCTVSTGLSTVTIDFSCAAEDLKKQLHVCDVVADSFAKFKVEEVVEDSAEKEVSSTPDAENTGYFNRITSLSSTLMRQNSQPVATTESEEKKQDAQEVKAQTQTLATAKDQQRVTAMLNFVQETDINLVVGEWVLARFSGTDGARWFLCQLELGSTNNYFGRRISSDKIDFTTVVPEPGLVRHWDDYMANKKTELCRVVEALVKGRDARRMADEVAGPGKEEKEKSTQVDIEGDDSDNENPEPKQKVYDFLRQGAHLSAELYQTITDMWGDRLDAMLTDTILKKVPKDLRSAIVSLNKSEDLLPAMFLSGVKVHMF